MNFVPKWELAIAYFSKEDLDKIYSILDKLGYPVPEIYGFVQPGFIRIGKAGAKVKREVNYNDAVRQINDGFKVISYLDELEYIASISEDDPRDFETCLRDAQEKRKLDVKDVQAEFHPKFAIALNIEVNVEIAKRYKLQRILEESNYVCHVTSLTRPEGVYVGVSPLDWDDTVNDWYFTDDEDLFFYLLRIHASNPFDLQHNIRLYKESKGAKTMDELQAATKRLQDALNKLPMYFNEFVKKHRLNLNLPVIKTQEINYPEGGPSFKENPDSELILNKEYINNVKRQEESKGWKVGDWCLFRMELALIEECEDGIPTLIKTASGSTSGFTLSESMVKLTIENIVTSQIVKSTYDDICKLNFLSLDLPSIYMRCCNYWKGMCINQGKPEYENIHSQFMHFCKFIFSEVAEARNKTIFSLQIFQ